MYTDALAQTRGATLESAARPQNPTDQDDVRARMIADAESRGIVVPDFIRQADTPAVRQWWAGVIDAATA